MPHADLSAEMSKAFSVFDGEQVPSAGLVAEHLPSGGDFYSLADSLVRLA